MIYAIKEELFEIIDKNEKPENNYYLIFKYSYNQPNILYSIRRKYNFEISEENNQLEDFMLNEYKVVNTLQIYFNGAIKKNYYILDDGYSTSLEEQKTTSHNLYIDYITMD